MVQDLRNLANSTTATSPNMTTATTTATVSTPLLVPGTSHCHRNNHSSLQSQHLSTSQHKASGGGYCNPDCD